MAETFTFSLRATKFAVVSGINYSRDEGGGMISSRHVEPHWAGTLTTPPLTRAERVDVLATLDDWVDRNLRFDFVHPLYRYPVGYTSASWPTMVGDPTLVSVNNLREIAVSGLPVGKTLGRGTRVTLIQGDSICYRKVRSDTLISSTVSQVLPIGPRLPLGIFSVGAAVRLASPFVRLMVVPESWDADEDIEDTDISFDVVESLR